MKTPTEVLNAQGETIEQAVKKAYRAPKQTFEKYLQERFVSDFAELCPTKDHFEDNYEKWLEDLQIDDWMKYATQWETVVNF